MCGRSLWERLGGPGFYPKCGKERKKNPPGEEEFCLDVKCQWDVSDFFARRVQACKQLKGAASAGARLPSLQLFPVIRRRPAGPSEVCVRVCERQRGNKKVCGRGVWAEHNSQLSRLATHAVAWSDFRPHVSPRV